MIVTHEMNFARAISNRVLYMDNGGICEDGTPDEIFDHPKNESTRKFIKRLKIFEAVIDSRDYDFRGFNEELDRYLLKNDVAPSDKYRIRLVIEELVHEILLPHDEKPFIRIKAEYSLQEKDCHICVTYKGEKFADTPEHCFIYNADVNGIPVTEKLDKRWYIDLAEKRLKDFGTDLNDDSLF
jgi:polar amino acid transport system ATP-binding protein